MQLLYGLVLRLPTSVVDAVLGLTAPKTLPAALNKSKMTRDLEMK
jgi:hypothetical protein